ncbi:hypothetical protein CEUSTIGMA_g831.t1 [Chlamydomonas eustigma]|uniref:Uncharacterized protein n=1 Tax=Chlamydomonas eustigma TaxID=1157962 RepID=A0A250WRC8_9CHLO|nr:hypothetical protein CEUSTIGMA_g831.t1 [Chlamydomonas eustigma]|eukprot:GAX73378.1 hypothetical protein CEUSTIGMA_g831.t1 [Chlamydomonas eustigma]
MCCNPVCAVNCGAFTGFLQFVLAAAILLVGTKLNPLGEKCPFGEEDTFAGSLCDTINTLGLVSIASALILSVSQGLLLTLCGAGAGLAEVLGRTVIAAAWLATAILSTVFGAKAAGKSHTDDPNWMLATIIMCWIMFLLSLAMAITAAVRLALCCCIPAAVVATGACCCPEQSCLALCCEALCIMWLYNMFCGRKRTGNRTSGYYAPAPRHWKQQQQQHTEPCHHDHHHPPDPHREPFLHQAPPPVAAPITGVGAAGRYPVIAAGSGTFVTQVPSLPGWQQHQALPPPAGYMYAPFASSSSMSAPPYPQVAVGMPVPAQYQHAGQYTPPSTIEANLVLTGYEHAAPSAPPAPNNKKV